MSATKVRRTRTKGTATMGRVTTRIVVESLEDQWALKCGLIKARGLPMPHDEDNADVGRGRFISGGHCTL